MRHITFHDFRIAVCAIDSLIKPVFPVNTEFFKPVEIFQSLRGYERKGEESGIRRNNAALTCVGIDGGTLNSESPVLIIQQFI